MADDVYPESLAGRLGAPPRLGAWRIDRKRLLDGLALGLGVAFAYAVGARTGLAFGFPVAQMSVLWPPNVVLIVALLLAPRSMWWIALGAALPAQLLTNASMGSPWPVALLYYASNAGQALLTVILLQRFGGGVPRFDSFRGTATFIATAAIIAPAVVTSGLAVGLRLIGGVPDVGLLWWSRFLTDVLSTLVLLPLALLVTTDMARLRRVRAWRVVEAGLLGLAFLGVGFLALALEGGHPRPQNLPASIYAPLALFLWAGLRFGVAGVSLALLIVAASSLWVAGRGLGPFASQPPVDSVLGLQLFLIELGLPVMLMAALIDERRRSLGDLRESNARVRTLAGKLIAAQEQERAHIARELHDEVGQALTTVKINLDTMRLIGDARAHAELLDEGTALVDQALEQVRDLSLLLRPSMLDHLGLEAALRWLLDSQAQRVGYQMRFSASGLQPPFPPDVEIICYRVAQEALTNVARHARASHVALEVRGGGGWLRLTVRDDGAGFDPVAMRRRASQGGSTGLLSLEERAALGNGRLRIDSAPGRGTALTLELPLAGGAPGVRSFPDGAPGTGA